MGIRLGFLLAGPLKTSWPGIVLLLQLRSSLFSPSSIQGFLLNWLLERPLLVVWLSRPLGLYLPFRVLSCSLGLCHRALQRLVLHSHSLVLIVPSENEHLSLARRLRSGEMLLRTNKKIVLICDLSPASAHDAAHGGCETVVASALSPAAHTVPFPRVEVSMYMSHFLILA